MAYIPSMLKLKDPALVERWEKLAPYVRQAPSANEFVIFANPDMPQWEVGFRRARTLPHLAFFMKVEASDVDALDELEEGARFSPAMTEYKVDSKSPFIIRRVTVTDMVVGKNNLELADERKRLGLFRSLVKMFQEVRSGILEPTVQELDELLEFLDGATLQE